MPRTPGYDNGVAGEDKNVNGNLRIAEVDV